LVVGIGGIHEGSAGLRRTHLEAMDAAMALRNFGVSAAAGIDDVGLVAVFGNDTERATWFVERELKELAGDDAQTGELRDTLRAFYAARMRVAPAAEHLFLHRNTLINRLGRVEALLGHSVAERTAEVQAALRVHDAMTRGCPDSSVSPERCSP
jgi:DNA-binding PucR family transcriptional regulator